MRRIVSNSSSMEIVVVTVTVTVTSWRSCCNLLRRAFPSRISWFDMYRVSPDGSDTDEDGNYATWTYLLAERGVNVHVLPAPNTSSSTELVNKSHSIHLLHFKYSGMKNQSDPVEEHRSTACASHRRIGIQVRTAKEGIE